MREAAARVVDFFETLSPASLDQLGALYTPHNPPPNITENKAEQAARFVL